MYAYRTQTVRVNERSVRSITFRPNKIPCTNSKRTELTRQFQGVFSVCRPWVFNGLYTAIVTVYRPRVKQRTAMSTMLWTDATKGRTGLSLTLQTRLTNNHRVRIQRKINFVAATATVSITLRVRFSMTRTCMMDGIWTSPRSDWYHWYIEKMFRL